MIYAHIGIVAETKERLDELMEWLQEEIEKGVTSSTHTEGHEGFKFRIKEDPCWDYDTDTIKHLEMLT